MKNNVTRKSFLIHSGLALAATMAGAQRLFAQSSNAAPAHSSSPSSGVPDFPQHGPQHDPALVKKFVVAGHFSLPVVKELIAAQPTLINAAWDWGNGDFETALGGASHMGRPDIARFLLDHDARMDIFAATMLGQLDIVKAAVSAFPNIVRVPGPHKIPLIAHAEKGGPAAVAVVDYLRPLVG